MFVEVDHLNVVLVIELMLKLRVCVVFVRVLIASIATIVWVGVVVILLLAGIGLHAINKRMRRHAMIVAVRVGVFVGQSGKHGMLMEIHGLDIVLIVKLVLELWVCVMECVVSPVFVAIGEVRGVVNSNIMVIIIRHVVVREQREDISFTGLRRDWGHVMIAWGDDWVLKVSSLVVSID